MWQVVPTSSKANNTFNVLLSIDGENRFVQLFLRYNPMGQYWTMDVTDGYTGEMYFANLPLVTAEGDPAANLLRQLSYFGLGCCAVVRISEASADRPGLDSLGTDFALVWGDTGAMG